MKKLVVVLFALALSSLAFAQENPPAGGTDKPAAEAPAPDAGGKKMDKMEKKTKKKKGKKKKDAM